MNLSYRDESFDVVVAANVIHLLDNPTKTLAELDRVLKKGGRIIIPTYVGKTEKGKIDIFSIIVKKLGANLKEQFTCESYQDFFKKSGYHKVKFSLIYGKVPCAVAVIEK